MTTLMTTDSRTPDRRIKHPLLADWRWSFRGRRSLVRRDTDDGYVLVDHIEPRLIVTVITIMILSGLDAHFTLLMIGVGWVSEANPVMAYFMESGDQTFINVKTAFTAGALLFLAVCSGLRVFTKVKVEAILYGVLALYTALIIYHLTLLMRAGLL